MALRVTAWASWAEWNTVYSQLASPSPSERLRGVRRVQAWRTRGRLPIAVDLTGSFVEVMLNDPVLNPQTTAPRSNHELQLMYAMTVVRLVNGIVDLAQRTSVARSIGQLAKQLDWPQWFVDLRHEATHQKMPSLPLLRLAAKEAVYILFERFWQPQSRLLERRGQTPVKQTRGVPKATAAPPRDKRLLDRKLRVLVAAESKRRKFDLAAKVTTSEPNEVGPRTSKDTVIDVSRELIDLASDESRLLGRISTVLLAGHPRTADNSQVRVVHSLCNRGSDNFALRLVRNILEQSLGLQSKPFEPSADNNPSLRNVCDGCTDQRNSKQEVLVIGTNLADSEAKRMQGWLYAMLSYTPARGDTNRFAMAVKSLTPLLRNMILRRIAELAGTSGRDASILRMYAAQVWQILAATQADVGANLFASLCASGVGAPLPTAGSVAPTTAPHDRSRLEAAVARREACTFLKASPTIEDMQALVRERRASSNRTLAVPEPWTAVGTVLDSKSLDIRCRPEGGAASAMMAQTLAQWQAWADTIDGVGDTCDADGAHEEKKVAVDDSADGERAAVANSAASPATSTAVAAPLVRCEAETAASGKAAMGGFGKIEDGQTTGKSGAVIAVLNLDEYRRHAALIFEDMQPL